MMADGWLQIALCLLAVVVLTPAIGQYMARVFTGERTFLHPVLRPVEKFFYWASGIREESEQRWSGYAAALIAFSFASFLFVYVIQRLQGWLPFNPMHFGTPHAPPGTTAMTPDLAFNTAASFTTNTNWQAYSGESTVSYFTQMAALAVQNFASAAVGIAVAVALIRGFARTETNRIGNFWVDLTRATVYVLLPISLIFALVLCAQGVPQTFHAYPQAKTLEGATQTIAVGPVASQEAIKMVGTNGGGFFGANSAHPFENPTPLTNYLELISMLVIAGGLTWTFGTMVGDRRQGWALFATMAILFVAGAAVCMNAEQSGNPRLARLGVNQVASATQSGGNLEGKEVRFGAASSALWATVATDTSTGATNSAEDSFTPLGGLIPLFNIETGEVIFGGTGSGLYGMLLYAILAVFIAGLMVGRTPEYLGKKIEQKEVKMAMLALVAMAASILIFSAASVLMQFAQNGYWNPPGAATANLGNGGPHGLSEILYAYSSGTGNNGSAFTGLNANTPWFNLTIGLAMLAGRFLMIVPVLAIAGSLAAKKKIPMTSGTFPTHGPLFVTLLIATILIVGALTFLPALSLGPLVEHLLMHQAAALSMPLGPIGV
jgi:K+-transporting ATPase ATPase A chain